MEQEKDFPLSYSTFNRKQDAAYDSDPNGDYVKADDVNELQESIERIEQVIGFEHLEKPVVEVLNSKVDKSSINEFGSPLFINYNGSSISTYETTEKRINAFNYLPYVMIRREESASFNDFISGMKQSGTTIFGIVNCNGTETNSSIESEIDWFKSKRVDGILLSSFGFESGLDRTLQNAILQYVHEQELTAIVTGEMQTTLLNAPHTNNPQQVDLQLNKGDIYLTQNGFISNGEKNDPSTITNLMINLNSIQINQGISVFVEDTADLEDNKESLYLYGKLLATLYNLDGYSLAPTSRYSLNEPIERFLHGFELGAWKVDKPVYVQSASTVKRTFSKGRLVFDQDRNEAYVEGVGLPPTLYTWQDKQIPGQAVALETADYNDDVTNKIVEAINAFDHKISFSKIEGMTSGGVTPEAVKDVVIRAINNSPAAITKNPPNGYDAIAGDDFIYGSLVDYIDANSIKSGTLSIDRIKANVVDAVNAYIGTAKIDAAKIGELTANHMMANVVDAINVYAQNTNADRAKISQAVISNLTAEHIKSGVIDAINANIDQAFVNGAIIEDGTIQSAQIGDGSITDAKIVELTANKIKSGTIDTSQVDIEGTNGHLRMTGNRLQVFDNQSTPVERVSVGDVNADGSLYGLRVRGIDGKTVLYDENGVYAQGITEGAVTNQAIANGAVENRHIVAETITGDKLVVDAITAREIAAKSISSNEIKANTITSSEIASKTITADEIKASTITGNELVADSITAREIASNTITANEIASKTITADSGIIDVAAIGSAEIAKAAITDAHIKDLNASKITAGIIDAARIQVGASTSFEAGYSPDELRDEMEDRIPYQVEIVSSNGLIFKNGTINTQLTAKVYRGKDDITDKLLANQFKWHRYDATGTEDTVWSSQHNGMKTIAVSGEDVLGKATFSCDILEASPL